MKYTGQILLLIQLLLLSSCVATFIPKIEEEKELLVVQGMITDKDVTDTIKLSKSLPLGEKSAARPVTGCMVTLSDDLGSKVSLAESSAGTYITPPFFHGVPGRSYILHIATNSAFNNFNYESSTMEMKPVPPIDSIYYEKTVIEKAEGFFKGVDGCQIYFNTHDPENICRFYRWDFSETWIFRLPFAVPNETCWVSDKSHTINIKSTAAFNEAKIDRFPINYITNVTDRLQTKYSIEINQYSLSEDEYIYWEKIQNIAVQVGGLYDIIPASVPSNIRCIENPAEKVLGFFSVSAKSSRRIFIKEKFEGIIDHYANCITDTVGGPDFQGVNVNAWIIIPHPCSMPCVPYFVITTHKECADCTLRGTIIKPDFWKDDK